MKRGFLGGSVVKNLPSKAGDMGSTPDSRKSQKKKKKENPTCLRSNKAHASQLLNPHNLQPKLSNKRSHLNEKLVQRNSRIVPAHCH